MKVGFNFDEEIKKIDGLMEGYGKKVTPKRIAYKTERNRNVLTILKDTETVVFNTLKYEDMGNMPFISADGRSGGQYPAVAFRNVDNPVGAMEAAQGYIIKYLKDMRNEAVNPVVSLTEDGKVEEVKEERMGTKVVGMIHVVPMVMEWKSTISGEILCFIEEDISAEIDCVEERGKHYQVRLRPNFVRGRKANFSFNVFCPKKKKDSDGEGVRITQNFDFGVFQDEFVEWLKKTNQQDFKSKSGLKWDYVVASDTFDSWRELFKKFVTLTQDGLNDIEQKEREKVAAEDEKKLKVATAKWQEIKESIKDLLRPPTAEQIVFFQDNFSFSGVSEDNLWFKQFSFNLVGKTFCVWGTVSDDNHFDIKYGIPSKGQTTLCNTEDIIRMFEGEPFYEVEDWDTEARYGTLDIPSKTEYLKVIFKKMDEMLTLENLITEIR